VGLRAELLAEAHLTQQGYAVLAKNHHTREGEVDLIVERGEVVVFVEVKARRTGALIDPLSSVTLAKQRQVVRAALDYIQRERLEQRSLRFDVLAITLVRGPGEPRIEHFENAFDASAVDDTSAR
jgi:putative endonuclease